MDANEKGVSLGEAAKGALKPALHAAVQAVAEGFQGGVGQQTPRRSKHAGGIKRGRNSSGSDSGSGSAKRKRTSSGSKRKRTIGKRRSAGDTAKQKGSGRQKAATAAKRVYKGKRVIAGNQLGGKTSAKKTRKRAERKGNSRTVTSYANTNF
jgi:hypothetical protein